MPEEHAEDLEDAFERRDVWYRRIGRVEEGSGVEVRGDVEEVEDYP